MLKRFLYIIFLMPLACIDPYEGDIPEGERLLTVEGYITTNPGPHPIRLTRTDTYGSVFEGLIRPVVQARVGVRDSEGLVTFLTEVTQGVYNTPESFRAIAGLSYILQIELQDGSNYTSLPERISSVPQLDSLSYRSIEVATENRDLPRSGVQLIAHFTDPGDQTNFYYWRTAPASYVLVANPELHTLPPTHPTNPRGPDPKDCCAICFVNEQSRVQNFAIASDEDFNGLQTRFPINFIEDDGLRFKDTYRAEVHQLSVSPGAHRFLKLIDQQLGITGSVFDQPPANIRGNMINLENPDEVVLGYFIAASVDSKQIYIQNENLEFLQSPKIIADDCRLSEGALTQPPADWNP